MPHQRFFGVSASKYLLRVLVFWGMTGVLLAPLAAGEKMIAEATGNGIPFNHPQELLIVNDTVMGGVSESRVSQTGQGMRFSGRLSLQNNGGFASVRRFGEAFSLTNEAPLTLTVIGDGRTYQLRLRTQWEFRRVAYAAEFETTAGEACTFTFTPQDFVPLWRGRYVQGAPRLRFDNVLQPGFMLADKQPGDFALEVLSLAQ